MRNCGKDSRLGIGGLHSMALLMGKWTEHVLLARSKQLEYQVQRSQTEEVSDNSKQAGKQASKTVMWQVQQNVIW